ncbi:MAG: histidine--tRNA ligase, partial [Gemmatimonadales bacterium]
MQPQPLPGFRDFYPDDLALRNHIFRTWRAVAARYGFEEYDGPPLEPLELYTAKSGDEIVGQLYHFVDKGGREVALRPEMTPTLARMVAARANGLRKPIRWFSIPQLFRYERQQRGRLREHFQLNCDLIGEPGPLGDAEIIALAVDAVRAFGLGPADFRVRISDRKVLTALLDSYGVAEAQLPLVYSVVDKIERMELAQAMDRLRGGGLAEPVVEGVIRLLERHDVADIAHDLEFPRGSPGTRNPRASQIVEPLRRTIDALDSMGFSDFIEIDLKIVRGLDYYTSTVFELFDVGRTLRAIAGGGRYDNLLQALGGVDLPALGFGMGDVVLAELLRERGQVPGEVGRVDIFVAGVTAEDLPHVLAVVRELRDAGLRVEYALSAQAVGKQLRLADARNA